MIRRGEACVQTHSSSLPLCYYKSTAAEIEMSLSLHVLFMANKVKSDPQIQMDSNFIIPDAYEDFLLMDIAFELYCL